MGFDYTNRNKNDRWRYTDKFVVFERMTAKA